jgi:hypothetical protein
VPFVIEFLTSLFPYNSFSLHFEIFFTTLMLLAKVIFCLLNKFIAVCLNISVALQRRSFEKKKHNSIRLVHLPVTAPKLLE